MGSVCAVDLGASRSRVSLQGKGLVYDAASVVAIDVTARAIKACGEEAVELVHKSGGRYVLKAPFKDGITSDPNILASYLHVLFHQIGIASPSKYKIGLAIPSQLTPLETDVLGECVRDVGAKGVFLVPSLLAAALTAGMDGSKADGFMAMIVGASRTETAVFSLGQMTVVRSCEQGGSLIGDRISKLILDRFGLIVAADTIEQIKEHLISFVPKTKIRVADLWGRDAKTGESRQVRVEDSIFIGEVLSIFNEIASLPSLVFTNCEAELVSDISYQGLYMLGGLSVVPGFKEIVEQRSQVVVSLLQRPSTAVVEGVLSLMTGDSKVTRTLSLS